MDVNDHFHLVRLLEGFGELPVPFRNEPASLEMLATFGIEKGVPECPFNLTLIECDQNGHVIRL